jgi:hypothetical protein
MLEHLRNSIINLKFRQFNLKRCKRRQELIPVLDLQPELACAVLADSVEVKSLLSELRFTSVVIKEQQILNLTVE